MACIITKDPNNKWIVVVDWSEWIAGLLADIGSGTIDISGSQWFLESGLTKEASTPLGDDDSYRCFLYGSGGTAGNKYQVTNRITYNPSALAPTDFTEDRTITVYIQDK